MPNQFPRSVSQTTLSRTSILLTLQVVVSGITLFILYRFIYRHLGPASLGLWSLVLATTGVARFTDLGLSGSLGRFVARYRELNDPKQVIFTVETGVLSIIVLVTGVGLLSYPVLQVVLSKVVPHELTDFGLSLLPYSIVSIVLSTTASSIQGAMDGCGRLDLRAIVAMVGNVCFVMLAIELSNAHGLIGLAWAQVIQSILVTASSWMILRRILPGLPFVPRAWRKGTFREMIGYSVAYQAAGISTLFCEPVTKALLARYGGLADVGLYEMASRVASQFRSLITAPQQSILPRAAAANENGIEAVVQLYHSTIESMSTVLLPTLAVLITAAPLISILWIGEFNIRFVKLLLVLVLAVGSQTFIGPAYFILLGVGSVVWIALSHGTIGAFTLIYGLVVAQYFGGPGVIMGSVMALLTGSAIVIGRFHRVYSIPWSSYGSKRNAYGVLLVIAALVIEVGIETALPYPSWAVLAPWTGPLVMLAVVAMFAVLQSWSSHRSPNSEPVEVPRDSMQ